jgi:hypothetical protein
MATAVATESKYKSFIKPVKFWQRSSQHKEPTIDDTINKDYQSQQPQDISEEEIEEEKEQQKVKRSSSYMRSFGFGRKSNSSIPSLAPIVALTESGKTEVYKLSTIDDAGAYIPPSPTLQGKRDHWIDANEDDIMNFRLPSSECLTTHVGEKHDFFTPSTFVRTQPYIFPIISHMSDSTLSTVPSLEDDGSDITTSSCRSSASYL